MQTFGQKLRQDISPIQPAVDAVTDRNVDQSVFCSERYRRFGANFRKWEKTCSPATTENKSDGF